jgi:L-lactate dehydrogenase complex protein LldF
VCPVKIDIPKLLLDLRSEVVAAKTMEVQNRWERLAFRVWARVMRHPRWFELAGMMGGAVMGEGWSRRLPAFLNVGPLKAWTEHRDIPAPAPKSFRQAWRSRS